MKVLRVKIEGCKLLRDSSFEMDFYASDRVFSDENGLNNLFSNIYTQNIISLVGINATGKTTILSLISTALDLILESTPINTFDGHTRVPLEGLKITTYLWSEDKVFEVVSQIERNSSSRKYYFEEETLKQKKASSVKSKKDLFNFTGVGVEIKRSELEEASKFLPKDISISTILTKDIEVPVVDQSFTTNMNYMMFSLENVSQEVFKYLDSSIEYLKEVPNSDEGKAPSYELKFSRFDPISVRDSYELEKFLSSGTVKGLNIFSVAFRVLRQGGYLIIDELENHLNKSIALAIMNLFKDSRTNRKGATLIFSTHYSELLDEFDRKDNIYVTRKSDEESFQITIDKYSNLVKRNDLKKSEVYLSSYIKGTAPSYKYYAKLKDSIEDICENGLPFENR